MFAKKVIFINWGNVPLLDFEFGPINLFSGGNGSGKTTAADGIQSIMTADLILVLENGRVTQKGKHADLVKRPGIYQQIYNMQTRIETELDEELSNAG